MTQQNVPVPPITEVDLALYSEGLLTSQRSAEVRQFLLDHPELNDLIWLEEPTTSNDRTNDDERSDSTPLTTRTTRGWPTVFKRIVGLASIAAGLFVLTTFWRSAQAVERTLSETESILRMTSSDASNDTEVVPQVLKSRAALEQLGNSFWMSERNSLRRDRLLAAIYVTQAKLEQAHFRQLSYAQRPQEFPPLQLCQKAIELLLLQKSDEQARQVLIDAYQLRGQTHFLFGTMLRTSDTVVMGMNQTSLAADSLTSALELISPENAGSAQSLEISGLLLKSLHKGGLAGRLTDASGSEVAAASELLPRLSQEFPALAAFLSANASANVYEAEFLDQMVDQLGAWLVQQPTNSAEQAVAMMDICNSYGLRLTNRLRTIDEPVPVFKKGIQLAGTIPSTQQSTAYWITYGRLLGNMADAFGRFNQLEEEVEWRPQAIAVFRRLSSQQRSEESFFELGWVTARQLIAEYRMHARHPDRPSLVPELLGALRQSSNNLATLDGYQLGDSETELIYGILAESTGDHSLGRGADGILRETLNRKSLPPVAEISLRSLLEDFRDNEYLRQLPSFQEALRLVESESMR